MKHKLLSLFVVCLALLAASATAAQPLRVFIRAGVKTHGPNQHDHPRFLTDYKQLLNERGAKADGSMEFPTTQQLDNTDVVVVFAADGMKITGDNRANFERFLKRGGGLVVVHDGVVADTENEWSKKVQGGAWIWPKNAPEKKPTKWLETEVGIYMVDDQHPIVKGLSNFDWKDEIYYDMDMAPDAHVIATSFQSVFILAPQLWTYEKTWDGGSAPYRAFVSLPGHEYTSFQTPHYRAVLLRGIAWAGKRANVDEFCSKEELGSLTYPEGGPTAPEKAAAKFNVHPDFNVTLAASEPVIEKVISLDWAPDGKMWVAETPEYPNGRTINKNDATIAIRSGNHPESFGQTDKENRPARDRISWLEDTNGDGVMDKKHVFADVAHGVPGGLELVTSLVPYKDGVIVAQAPDILWLRDTNGDGVCDKVEVLYTGFGTFDTHAVINNFRWGLDGWVYTAVGYSAGQPRSPITGKDFGRITAGILRFKPDGSALEQVASGSCNTWGFDFMPDGEMIYTTATCGEPICHIVMPEKVLARGNVGGVRTTMPIFDENKIYPAVHHTRPAYVQIDWVGAFTAAAGSCIYNGGAWPEKWNNSHFVSEATMSLLHHEFIAPNGVSYKGTKEASRREREFVAGSDLWFRPIHQRVGPDGALYLVDFYNQAAIHNDTRGPAHGARNAATRPDRDHHFSRIWRIQHKEAKKLMSVAMNKNEPGTLVKLLASDNGWQRETAARLLRENGAGGEVETLKNIVKSANGAKTYTRIAALYALAALGQADRDTMGAALRDPDAALRKNVLRIAAERDNSDYTPSEEGVRGLLNDPEPRVRLNALVALGTANITPEVARVVVEAWPKLNDKYLQSAAVGVAAKDSSLFLDVAFGAADPAFLADFVGHVTRVAANKQDAAVAARIVTTIAAKPAATDGLKQAVLETLGVTLRASVVPAWNDSLASAFKSLLTSARPGVPGAALPLIARWDTAGSLANELKPVIASLGAKLSDNSLADDQRGQVAANLLGVRKLDGTIVPNVGKLLGSSASAALQKRVIEALGATGDSAAAAPLIGAFPKLDADLREAAFGQLVKRADWSAALVEAMRGNASLLNLLGPANQFRLRTHADKSVAAKANEVIDALKGPEQKQKDDLLAKFRPEVEKFGNVENGKKVFLANCAACHKFKSDGADFAPNLTGMGAHGPGELLIHILDPNRLVEPNFVSVSIETKDDQTFDGIVLRENQTVVVLRNQSAENEIRKDNIKSRTSTGRSLMPEGFEQLGAEGLRDLLAYICADELRFRILDLSAAFTANTTDGIYNSKESREETLRFKKFGAIKFGDVPFDLISPKKSLTGNNVIVLKGGSGISRGYPQKVEAKVGMAISKLHVLGGIGGWAWPYDGEAQKGINAAKITVHFAGGGTEEFVLKNGIEVADYVAKNDVPGSTEVPDLCHNGRQVRYLSRAVKGRGVVEKISIESFNNIVAPTFVALTVETGDGNSSSSGSRSEAPAPKKASVNWGPGLKTLLIGGGASHDYNKWFNEADVALLNATGKFSANYVEPQEATAELVRSADVLIISANKAFPDPAVREAIFAHANAGKGLILLHPGLWYNWPDWADYNRVLAGGGSRGHDRYGEFDVTVAEPSHPIMKGVPEKFLISDELYYFEPDSAGTPIKVLATATSKAKNKTFPQVFIVEHPKTRIVGLTLGHDGVAHNHPAYQQLLKNALNWVATK